MANLLTIAAFKYAGFLTDNMNALSGTEILIGSIILPLGISFFTFEQISFLVDVRRGHEYHAKHDCWREFNGGACGTDLGREASLPAH